MRTGVRLNQSLVNHFAGRGRLRGYDKWQNFLEIIKKGIKNYPNSTADNKDIDLQEIVEIELNTDFAGDIPPNPMKIRRLY